MAGGEATAPLCGSQAALDTIAESEELDRVHL